MKTIPAQDLTWSQPAIERIVRLVGERTGLVFSQPRRHAIEAIILREASRAGCPDLAAYEQRLRRDDEATDSLAAELTIGETYFFRDPAQLDLLRSEILPEVAAAPARPEGVRIWSAGCASGEEAYSVAIICHELGIGSRTRILATDLSRERLDAAREARYGRWSFRGVPDAVTTAYFRRRDTRYDLIDPIRAMVEFRYLNLAELGGRGGPDPHDRMDVILCRNVLIYFDAATTARVIGHLLGGLRDGGWLLLGASDPPATDYADCEVIVTRAGLVYRRQGSARPRRSAAAWRQEPVPALAATGLGQREQFSPLSEEARPAGNPPPAPPPPAEVEPLRGLLARAVEAHAHGRGSEAAELARRFLELGGDELAAWVIRVRALANAESLALAGQVCAAALEHHPLSAELTYLHSLLLARAGRYADAAEAARRALYLDRTLAVAHLVLGDALARIGRDQEAARAFRSAHRLLATADPDAVAPASGGERSGRLAATAAARLELMERAS